MKYSRHAKILDIVENGVIETQDDLAEALQEAGFSVTQATVSRDIKELRLIKELMSDGRYKYTAVRHTKGVANDRFLKLFKESVLGLDYTGQFIVIKTLVGAASAAAAAIDALDAQEIVGTLAGDDTIFLLVRSEEQVQPLIDRFNDLLD